MWLFKKRGLPDNVRWFKFVPRADITTLELATILCRVDSNGLIANVGVHEQSQAAFDAHIGRRHFREMAPDDPRQNTA